MTRRISTPTKARALDLATAGRVSVPSTKRPRTRPPWPPVSAYGGSVDTLPSSSHTWVSVNALVVPGADAMPTNS